MTTHEVRQLNFGLSGKLTHRALYTIRPDMVYVFLIRHLAEDKLDVDRLDD